MTKTLIPKSIGPSWIIQKIKTPSIPPILASGKAVTNIVEKESLLNNFFASQCTHLENTSKFPQLLMKTDKQLNAMSFKDSDITAIIKPLKPTKAPYDSIVRWFHHTPSHSYFPATWEMVFFLVNNVPKKEEKKYREKLQSLANFF